MLIPVLPTFRVEDFPKDVQPWISKLFFPLNSFIDASVSALNGNITLVDNIPCQTITLAFTYGGSTDFPKISKWSVGANTQGQTTIIPIELRVCSATENGTPIAILHSWQYDNGTVKIYSIYKVTSAGVVALTMGAAYNIVLRGQP